VKLVLLEQRRLSGMVLMPNGAGVAGARVTLRRPEVSGEPFGVLHTDATGRFATAVPPATKDLLIDVSAPGVGWRFLRGRLPDDRMLTIELDPNGGRLVLDNVLAPTAQTITLFHEGGYTYDITSWSRVHGEVVADGVLRVPLLAPGIYRACRFFSIQEWQGGTRGIFPEQRCAEGALAPGGELFLTVPGELPAEAIEALSNLSN
jgi:hypothetical protein